MLGLLDLKRWRFVAIGILVSYGMLWISDYLLPETQSGLIGIYATTAIVWVVAFSVGGVVARRDFLVPAAVSTALVVGGSILHTAYLFRKHDLPISSILTGNLPIFAITIVATAIGATIGMWFSAKARRQIEVT